jgi:hypothetical protein
MSPEDDDPFACFQPKASKSPPTLVVHEDLHFGDDFEAFPLPTPIVECSVPTRAYEASDLEPFDPLGLTPEARREMTLNLAKRLLNSGPFPLVNLAHRPFPGEGVYALFYHGDLSFYAPLRSPGATCPIYIGKSAREGRRQGGGGEAGQSLHTRLTKEHARGLGQTLGLEHFTFRFVLTPAMLVDLAEHTLIELFQPLWCSFLPGFGARHHAKDNRRNGRELASPWDSLHPGRPGAGTEPRPLSDILTLVEQSLPQALAAYHQAMDALQRVG